MATTPLFLLLTAVANCGVVVVTDTVVVWIDVDVVVCS